MYNFYNAFYSSQCHIAAANMMTAAATIGIDSCPVVGYDSEKVREVLNIDNKKYEIAMIIPFSYRKNQAPKKNRPSIEELVEYM